MYIRHLSTNAKRVFERELGQHTLILGDNWSGKTGVIDGLEYLLTGSVDKPDLGKLPSKVISLAAENANEFYVRGELSDGQKASVSIVRKDGKCKKDADWHLPVGIQPGKLGAFVDVSVRELMSAGDQARRSGLCRLMFGTDLSVDAVLSRIPLAFHDTWKSIIFDARAKTQSSEFVDLIYTAKKIVEARRRESNKEAKGKTADAFGGIKDAKWTANDDQRLKTVTEEISQKQRAKGVWDRSQAEGSKRLVVITAELRKLEDEYVKLGEPVSEAVVAMADTVKLALKVVEINGSRKTCIACGSVRVKEEQVQVEKVQVEKLWAAYQKIADSVRAVEIKRSIDKLSDEQQQIQKSLSESDPATNLQVLIDEQKALSDRKTKLEEAQRAKREAIEAEKQSSALTAILSAIQSTITETIEDGTTDFNYEVSKWLPKDWAVEIDIVDNVKVALNGRPWHLLSGAEQLLVMSAIARRQALKLNVPIKMLRLDEVAVSVNTLGMILKAVGREVKDDPITQTIVCAISNQTDKLEVPDNWTVVRI